MMTFLRSLLALALAAPVFSAPFAAGDQSTVIPASYMAGFRDATIQTSAGGQALCISGFVDVTASAMNTHLNLEEPANQTVVTELILEFLSINSTLPKQVTGSKTNVSGTYGIYSQLCYPNGAINATTVEFLIHGGGADRSYWNIAPNYSYVDYAAEQGYTTFLYDRLGTGLSDHPDALQIVQFELEIAIAHELVQLLRKGGIASQVFEHVVGVGHSFGSFQTSGVTLRYPNDFDAVVLTGFSQSTTGAGFALTFAGVELTIASQAQPSRFADLSNGYLTSGSIQGTQWLFFKAPGFDPALLDLAEATKQTLTLGELLTTGDAIGVTNFTGPVDVVDGDADFPNCSGNCLTPHNVAAAVLPALYPKASNGSSYYIAPLTGHALNYHYATPGAYEHIHGFIKKNGL